MDREPARRPAPDVRRAGPRVPVYRVRAGVTPPGVHLVNPAGRSRSAHGRPHGRVGWVVRHALVALAVFALAVLVVTGVEVVVGHPLSGGDPGQTSLGTVLHPRR